MCHAFQWFPALGIGGILLGIGGIPVRGENVDQKRGGPRSAGGTSTVLSRGYWRLKLMVMTILVMNTRWSAREIQRPVRTVLPPSSATTRIDDVKSLTTAGSRFVVGVSLLSVGVLCVCVRSDMLINQPMLGAGWPSSDICPNLQAWKGCLCGALRILHGLRPLTEWQWHCRPMSLIRLELEKLRLLWPSGLAL